MGVDELQCRRAVSYTGERELPQWERLDITRSYESILLRLVDRRSGLQLRAYLTQKQGAP